MQIGNIPLKWLGQKQNCFKKHGETSSGVIILIGEMLGGASLHPVHLPSTPKIWNTSLCAGGWTEQDRSRTDTEAGSWAWGVGSSDRAHDSPISTFRLSRRQFPLQTSNTGRQVGDAQGVDENSTLTVSSVTPLPLQEKTPPGAPGTRGLPAPWSQETQTLSSGCHVTA